MNKLHEASLRGHTEVVQLLLDKGAPVDEKTESGRTALMWASNNGHTEVVKLLLDKGASVNEKDKEGSTALMGASQYGRTGVVVLLLDNGASVDEKDEDGYTALLRASWKGHTEVVKLLLDKGASVGVKNNDGKTVLPTVIAFDEDQLGRMAAAQLHRLLPQGQSTDLVHAEEVEEEVFLEERTAFAEATGTAVLQLARLAGFARARARALRSSDPRSADDHQALFGRLQLAAAASIQNDESGEARYEEDVQKLFNSKDGRKALEHAVEIEAKELLAQPVVQKYIKVAWHGPFDMEDPELELLQWVLAFVFLLLNLLGVPPTLVDRVSGVLQWAFFFVLLLLQLLFLLPLVALVPALEPWLTKKLRGAYLLRLPVVKFGLACAADLTLALALTFLPAADLATAPVAQLLLVWVGSGLLWEARQLMAPSSSDARLLLTRVYDRLVAYLGDYINRVDATALIFSFAALVAFMSADDSEDATATSLRAVAVFLLWLRVIRALLVSPQFGPYVLMFFRMLCNDVLYFLVLLLFLLVAFAASWTVLLGPSASIAGCADELGGVDFHTTLLRIFEGALTGNDYFDCARNSTNSPVAAWVVTFAYVTLTAVLLLNMLIAMMAKTFDDISEASGTTYLFLFAQRTLAHQNEPPTPPPLNALGLPCKAMCLLWAWVQGQKQKHPGTAKETAAPAEVEEPSEDASAKLKGTAVKATADKARFSTGSVSSAREATQEEEAGEIEAATEKKATDKAQASVKNDGQGEDKEETFTKKIAPLAEKITEYIIDHQDDAAQEDRWRTIMKRDMTKSFKKVEARVQKVKEEIKEEIKAEVQKVKEEVQAMHSKMDETLQLVKSQR